MARSARRYELFLPINYNDGRPIERSKFKATERQLLDRFGGLTSLYRRFPLRGIWQGQTRLYFDRVIYITVLDFHRRGSSRFFTQLKRNLLRELEQEEILITETATRVY